MKKLNTNSNVLLLLLLLGISISSCTKETPKPQETIKELLAVSSSEKTVALGDAITFTDLSLGVASRTWTFPGGDPATSNEAEVEVVFENEGDITPTLEIEYFDGTTEMKTFTVKVFPILVAGFTLSERRIKVGESVTLTDESIGEPTSWFWEFDGGDLGTSTLQNPEITFNVNKPVSVKLTVTRADDGSSTSVEKLGILQVGPPEMILNGDFETGAVIDWQTWNGAAFPYGAEVGGANGTSYTSVVNYEGTWGFGQIISRDFPNNKVSVEPGKNYIMSLYIKADAPVTLGTFRAVNHLPDWSGACGGCTPEDYSEYYPISGTAIPYNVTSSWTKVSVEISIPDDGVVRSNVYPDIILNGATNSKVYIDEISLKLVE